MSDAVGSNAGGRALLNVIGRHQNRGKLGDWGCRVSATACVAIGILATISWIGFLTWQAGMLIFELLPSVAWSAS
jgi:hypothetical protein